MVNKKSKIDVRVIIAGLACITIIEVCALFNGINGTLMTLVLMIIAGAIGVALPVEKIFKK